MHKDTGAAERSGLAARWAGTGLGTREPHFTLVLGGEAALTLCSNHALFHALLLFLQVGCGVPAPGVAA